MDENLDERRDLYRYVFVRDIHPGPKRLSSLELDRRVGGRLLRCGARRQRASRAVEESRGGHDHIDGGSRPRSFGHGRGATTTEFGVGETLFFELVGEIEELWKSDGTAEGTSRVKVIIGSRIPAVPRDAHVEHGGTRYLMALRDTSGHELWTSDGTNAGTVLIKDICPGSTSSLPGWLTEAGESVFFSAGCYFSDEELWKTDGTSEGRFG